MQQFGGSFSQVITCTKTAGDAFMPATIKVAVVQIPLAKGFLRRFANTEVITPSGTLTSATTMYAFPTTLGWAKDPADSSGATIVKRGTSWSTGDQANVGDTTDFPPATYPCGGIRLDLSLASTAVRGINVEGFFLQ